MKRLILVLHTDAVDSPPGLCCAQTEQTAPLFSLQDVTGKEYSLGILLGEGSEKKSSGVIVSFFASWCIPCRHELPIINSLVDELRSKGITVVLIDVKESVETIKALLKELKVDKPVVLSDGDGKDERAV